MDPEIPVLSVVDLGMITAIEILGDQVLVKMIPTFSACPAINVIRNNIRIELEKRFLVPVQVDIDPAVQWNSNRMSEAGREKLRRFRITPPEVMEGEWREEMLSGIACPFCQSHQTENRSLFGSTLCRALYYCKACGNLFEHFKPLE